MSALRPAAEHPRPISASSALLPAVVLGLCVALIGCGRREQPPATAGEAPITLRVTEQLTFDVKRFTCSPGQPVRLRIQNIIPAGGPDIAHNAVLLMAGTDIEAFAQAVLTASAETHYLPEAFRPRIIASTRMMHPGQEQELTFSAPTTPGTYPLVCSFPGHCIIGMRAEFIVK